MRSYRWPASFLSLLMSGSPAAFASTIVHQLGVAPLLGVSSTTSEVRGKVRTHPRLMHLAASEIGLSPHEYAEFYQRLMDQRPGWVTIPRHLDAMSWSVGGVVHAEHDVTIPKGVKGWEVDLSEKHQVIHIYLPMICGNLSVLRTPLNTVAALPPPPLPGRYIPTPVQPVVDARRRLDGFSQQIPPVSPTAAIIHHPRLFWPIFGTAVLAAVLLDHPHHGSPTSVVTLPPALPPPVSPPVTPPVSVTSSGPVTPPTCSLPTPPPPPCGCKGQTWAMSRHSGSFSISL